MHKILDTPYVHLVLQDDLLTATYKKGLKIDLDIAKEVVRSRLEFADHKPIVALVYNAGVVSMTKEARDFLSSDDGVRGVIAGAIVLDSPFGSFLGNFYLSVAKPKRPIRIFSKPGTAMKWLQQFRKQIADG